MAAAVKKSSRVLRRGVSSIMLLVQNHARVRAVYVTYNDVWVVTSTDDRCLRETNGRSDGAAARPRACSRANWWLALTE